MSNDETAELLGRLLRGEVAKPEARGMQAFLLFMASNPNPFAQGSLERAAWWSAFIREAEKVRDDAVDRWSAAEAEKLVGIGEDHE